jgi:hypothetical protein
MNYHDRLREFNLGFRVLILEACLVELGGCSSRIGVYTDTHEVSATH